MSERTTVRLPEALMAQAKRKAFAEGRTLTALIEDGLRRVVSEASERREGSRVLPRVSTARGGLREGIDPIRFSPMEELDDLATLERINRQE